MSESMSSITVNIVSKEHLDKFWSQVEPFLDSGLLMCEGELNVSQLRMFIVQGAAHLIVGTDNDTGNIKGALAFEIVNYPNMRVANIISYGGYNLFASEEDFDVVKQNLRRAGISSLQGWWRTWNFSLLSL